MFLSIFLASCRPVNLIQFLNNLKDTCDDPSSFEVLIKVDEGSTDLIRNIETFRLTSPYSIKFIASAKLDGYYTLHHGYNELLLLSNPESYFCWLLTDEIRIQTKGWDRIIKKYVGFFPDDIIRLKLSIFQLKNYIDFFECLPSPDNYAVTSRKWLEITGGWGDFWGPDSWHQCIDFYLGASKNKLHPEGNWRSIPLMDIQIKGQEAGQGIQTHKEIMKRAQRINQGWNRFSTHQAQEKFHMLAQRLNAHIYAIGNNHHNYFLEEDYKNKTISLYCIDRQFIAAWSYHVPYFSVKFYCGYKKLSIRRAVYCSYVSIGTVYYLIKFYKSIIKFKNNVIKFIKSIPRLLLQAIIHILSSVLIIIPSARKRILVKKLLDRLDILYINKKSFNSKKVYNYDGKKLKLMVSNLDSFIK